MIQTLYWLLPQIAVLWVHGYHYHILTFRAWYRLSKYNCSHQHNLSRQRNSTSSDFRLPTIRYQQVVLTLSTVSFWFGSRHPSVIGHVNQRESPESVEQLLSPPVSCGRVTQLSNQWTKLLYDSYHSFVFWVYSMFQDCSESSPASVSVASDAASVSHHFASRAAAGSTSLSLSFVYQPQSVGCRQNVSRPRPSPPPSLCRVTDPSCAPSKTVTVGEARKTNHTTCSYRRNLQFQLRCLNQLEVKYSRQYTRIVT